MKMLAVAKWESCRRKLLSVGHHGEQADAGGQGESERKVINANKKMRKDQQIEGGF